MRYILYLSLYVTLFAGAGFAQEAGGSVSGVVVKQGSGEALPGSKVALVRVGESTIGSTVDSGSDGSFTFDHVAEGQYRLVARRDDGFLPAEYGALRPNTRGVPITLAGGQNLKGLKVEMAATAAISGHVYNADGEPVAYAKVQALKTIYAEGKRAFNIAQTVQTNDEGEYRLYWLPPGRYFIDAKEGNASAREVQSFIRLPGEGTLHSENEPPVILKRVLASGKVVEEVAVPIMLPGTSDIEQATPIDLHSGDNLNGADIRLPEMPRARKVRGTVIDGTTGQPLAVGKVVAALASSTPEITAIRTAPGPNGSFELVGLAAGVYDLYATKYANPGAGGGSQGHVRVEIGEKDLENIVITVGSTFDLYGRFIVDGSADLDLTGVRLTIVPYPSVSGVTPGAQEPRAGINSFNPNVPQPDGTFMLPGIGTGDFRIGVIYVGEILPNSGTIVKLPTAVYIKSAKLGSEEILGRVVHFDPPPDGELQVVLGTDVASISGNVHDDQDTAVPNCIVVVMPDVRERTDLYFVGATDSTGNFHLRVPPGSYKVFAFDYVEPGAWLDPIFIQTYEALGTPLDIQTTSAALPALKLIKLREP